MLPVKLAGAALGAHVCITQSAVAYATLKRPQAAKLQDGASPELRRHVLEVVSQMYSGRGLTARLSSDVAFEDPLALCQGDAEVREAFRGPESMQARAAAGAQPGGHHGGWVVAGRVAAKVLQLPVREEHPRSLRSCKRRDSQIRRALERRSFAGHSSVSLVQAPEWNSELCVVEQARWMR
eukprot:TRINITY_DN32777_c0_g1_i1.p1 TRINITY_DN32777_c0_g1~~TRINITY_DN32777_c0_g1_i1.p1  ORF type:complete len:181 (-),score=23.73 TRINITY_DN32777_c0_g1_i1:29-571(-)